MTLDQFPSLSPGVGSVESAEVLSNDDVLVKAFALGPDATLEPHEHADSTNVFHVLQGTVTVIQDDVESPITAPGVVIHDRGVVHGARNDTDEVVAFTATMSPHP